MLTLFIIIAVVLSPWILEMLAWVLIFVGTWCMVLAIPLLEIYLLCSGQAGVALGIALFLVVPLVIGWVSHPTITWKKRSDERC
jgi:hypothetical protein